jgi:hypothetical protein
MPAAPPAPSIRSTHNGTYSWKHPVVARSRDVRLCAIPRRMTRPEPAWHVLCVFSIFKRRHRLASLGCRVGGHHVLDAAATPVPTRNGILSPTAPMKQRLGPENQRLVHPGATAQLWLATDVASSSSDPLRSDESGVPRHRPWSRRYIGVPFRFERGLT